MFGVNILLIAGGLGLAVGITLILAMFLLTLLTIIGVIAVLIFWKTRKIIIPKATLFVLNLLEIPIKNFLLLFNIDESFLNHTIIEIQNRINIPYYASTKYTDRALFLPQCLRNPKCPAPLNEEGIQCKACGRCGIFKIKEHAEGLGYKVFITPGSTLIRRMVKRYKPKAIIGVGCHMEVKEGVVAISSYGIPSQGVVLERDGCVNTRVNVLKLLEKIYLNTHRKTNEDEELSRLASEISAIWDETTPTNIEIKKARETYKI